MRKVRALLRAGWLEANSYRMKMVLTLVSLVATAVPLYYVSHAIESVVKDSIADQGGQYFAFLVVGMITFAFLRTAISALPGEVSGAISSGTLEALLGTPTRLWTILAGMTSYSLTWAAVRCTVLLVFAWFMGAHVLWSRAFLAIGILALIVVVHAAFGIMATALILAFRASGPLENGVIWVSTILGGVYYPTQAIPEWLSWVSRFVPLTYGLRALRRALLEKQMTYEALAGDLLPLAIMGTVLMAVAVIGLNGALRYARRAGTLAQY